MCSTFGLVMSDYDTFSKASGLFTHISDAHGITSWLDHVISSSFLERKILLENQQKLICKTILGQSPPGLNPPDKTPRLIPPEQNAPEDKTSRGKPLS